MANSIVAEKEKPANLSMALRPEAWRVYCGHYRTPSSQEASPPALRGFQNAGAATAWVLWGTEGLDSGYGQSTNRQGGVSEPEVRFRIVHVAVDAPAVSNVSPLMTFDTFSFRAMPFPVYVNPSPFTAAVIGSEKNTGSTRSTMSPETSRKFRLFSRGISARRAPLSIPT